MTSYMTQTDRQVADELDSRWPPPEAAVGEACRRLRGDAVGVRFPVPVVNVKLPESSEIVSLLRRVDALEEKVPRRDEPYWRDDQTAKPRPKLSRLIAQGLTALDTSQPTDMAPNHALQLETSVARALANKTPQAAVEGSNWARDRLRALDSACLGRVREALGWLGYRSEECPPGLVGWHAGSRERLYLLMIELAKAGL